MIMVMRQMIVKNSRWLLVTLFGYLVNIPKSQILSTKL